MSVPAQGIKPADRVSVRWQGDMWIDDCTVHRVYDSGADVICGSRGCFYVLFADIRKGAER